jgi:uncharacterized membrane protein (DUF106 family)
MENFLNIVWENMYATFLFLTSQLDILMTPIHTMFGPGSVIILLAVLTVCITKFMSHHFRTKRHTKLEEDFHYWLSVREEAMQCEDREKGKRMARNIDQAKLNRSYYDYFFEGLLLSLANTYLPVLMVLSYVNRYYRPERLVELTGKDFVMQFGNSNGEPVLIGSIFFYLCALLSTYVVWAIIKKVIERNKMRKIAKCIAVSNESKLEEASIAPVMNGKPALF